MFCDDLDGGEEGAGGTKAQETEDTSVPIADPCCTLKQHCEAIILQ